MNRTIERRLAAIEAMQCVEAPTSILADRPMSDDEGSAALSDWRALIARGEASVSGAALCVLGPVLSEEEWQRQYATAH